MRLEDVLTQKDGDCRLWLGSISSQGYATARIDGEKRYVHRLLSPGSEGMEVHHICGNRSCVNPDHLMVVTAKQHSEQHRADACPHGHSYTFDNVYITPAGTRQCRECKRINNRAAAARRAR